MIDTSTHIVPLVGGLPRQPASAPLRPPETRQELPERSHRAPVELSPEKSEILLELSTRQRNSTEDQHGTPLSLRGKQAMQAYQSLKIIDEREYVTRVLGIDEFV